MKHHLTQLGSKLYLKASDVVALTWVEEREYGYPEKKLYPAHAVITTEVPADGGIMGPHVRREAHDTDWPFEQVRYVLGLPDSKEPWKRDE